MKNLLFVVAILVSTSFFAQNTVEKMVADFKEVKVFDKIQVTLIKSSETKVSIRGERKYEVKILEDEGVLIIRLETSERLDGEDTFVDVYYTNLEIIDTNEGSVITSKETIISENLELKAQEGGKIKVTIASENVIVKSVSGGEVSASGAAKMQDITINSGGKYYAKDLQTETTEVSVTAGGRAEIYVTETVDAKVTAGGNIKIFGNPKDIKKKKFAGGRIEIIEN
ncbi:head GIN domain-containing protein [Jejudonia soesokkakensis]|uniref:Head GIN domain-containing protein n=1 Tax=Jejudonia soesokkakensis TaxID=1323432 RepID=A0ABW2MMR8_9FLAO